MARVNSDEVQTLLETGGDYDTENEPDLTPFIDSANALVSRVATCAETKGETLSSTELALIELWLAAHFYCITDRTYAEKKTLDSSAKFHGKTDKGLDFTPYGQTAKDMDPTGCLVEITSRKKARVLWLGRPPSEQTDYHQRD